MIYQKIRISLVYYGIQIYGSRYSFRISYLDEGPNKRDPACDFIITLHKCGSLLQSINPSIIQLAIEICRMKIQKRFYLVDNITICMLTEVGGPWEKSEKEICYFRIYPRNSSPDTTVKNPWHYIKNKNRSSFKQVFNYCNILKIRLNNREYLKHCRNIFISMFTSNFSSFDHDQKQWANTLSLPL